MTLIFILANQVFYCYRLFENPLILGQIHTYIYIFFPLCFISIYNPIGYTRPKYFYIQNLAYRSNILFF